MAQCDEWLPTAGPSELTGVSLMCVADHDGAGPQLPLLYATGAPTGGVTGLQRWDGAHWETLPSYYSPQSLYALPQPVGNLAAGLLIVGAREVTADPDSSRVLRAWNGQAWQTLSPSTHSSYSSNAVVQAVTTWDPDGPGPQTPWLIVAGVFNRFADVATSNVVAWDGAQWRTLRGGRPGSVGSLTSFDPDGDGPAQPLLIADAAAWNGTAWQTLGAGLGAASVTTVMTFDRDGDGPLPPELYAAGSFTVSGSATLPHVARWDGTDWVAPWTGMGPPATVYSLTGFDPDGAGPLPPRLVAASGAGVYMLANEDWTLQSPNNGVERQVAVMDPDGPGPRGTELLTGGTYTTSTAGLAPYNGIFSWNGNRWTTLGNEVLGGTIQRFHRFDPDGDGPLPASIYASGSFTLAGGQAADGLAIWNGLNWDGLGTPNPSALKNIHRMVTYDADGSGPMLPWLVAIDWQSSALVRVMRWGGTAWINLDQFLFATQLYSVAVIDADGAGPQPTKLFVSGQGLTASSQSCSVASYTTGPRFVSAGTPNPTAMSLLVYDADGNGPQAPLLHAFGAGGTSLLSRYNGATWANLVSGSSSNNATIAEMVAWDPDGAGAHLPVPVLTSASMSSGGLTFLRAAMYNGARLQQLGDEPTSNLTVYGAYSFDPDGSGPLTPQLILTGWDENRYGVSLRLGSQGQWTPLTGSFGPPIGGLTGSSKAMIDVDPDGDGPLPPELWIGGAFSSAGGQPACNFARWRLTGALPVVMQPPTLTRACAGVALPLSLVADGHGAALTYQWRIEDPGPTGWTNLTTNGAVTSEGRQIGIVSGIGTPMLVFTPAQGIRTQVQCLVSTPCGSVPTAPLLISTMTPCCGTADFNSDGDVGTDQDIEAFFACLSGFCCATCPSNADFNGDGDVGTDQDIEAFFRVLAGGNC